MQRLQAFKFELRLNGEQRNMRRFVGSCRFVFNEALALQKRDPETAWLIAYEESGAVWPPAAEPALEMVLVEGIYRSDSGVARCHH